MKYKIVSLFVFSFVGCALWAQGPGFPPPPPAVPIDGGALLLLGAGAAYGIQRMRSTKKES